MKENEKDLDWGYWPNKLVLGLGLRQIGVGWRLPWGSTILDLGCGEGQNAKWLAATRGSKVTAVDKREDYIQKVRSRPEPINAWYKKINAEIKEKIDDVLNYLEEDETFDAIICMNILQQLPEDKIVDVIKRIQAKTKINGFNAIAAFVSADPKERAERVQNGGSFFQEGELKEYYDDGNWSIIDCVERKTRPESHGRGEEHQHHVVELIAKKVK